MSTCLNKCTPDDLKDARFGDSVSDAIDRAINDSIPINTTRTKNCVWNQFTLFCAEKQYELTRTLTVEQIADILKDWAYNMKRKDGQDYKEGVVKTLWNITAKQVQELYYNKYKMAFNPFHDVAFKVARDARDAKRRQLKKFDSKRKQSSSALTHEQSLQMLNFYDENTPAGLIHKLHHIVAAALAWTHGDACNACVQYFRDEVGPDGTYTGK